MHANPPTPIHPPTSPRWESRHHHVSDRPIIGLSRAEESQDRHPPPIFPLLSSRLIHPNAVAVAPSHDRGVAASQHRSIALRTQTITRPTETSIQFSASPSAGRAVRLRPGVRNRLRAIRSSINTTKQQSSYSIFTPQRKGRGRQYPFTPGHLCSTLSRDLVRSLARSIFTLPKRHRVRQRHSPASFDGYDTTRRDDETSMRTQQRRHSLQSIFYDPLLAVSNQLD